MSGPPARFIQHWCDEGPPWLAASMTPGRLGMRFKESIQQPADALAVSLSIEVDLRRLHARG